MPRKMQQLPQNDMEDIEMEELVGNRRIGGFATGGEGSKSSRSKFCLGLAVTFIAVVCTAGLLTSRGQYQALVDQVAELRHGIAALEKHAKSQDQSISDLVQSSAGPPKQSGDTPSSSPPSPSLGPAATGTPKLLPPMRLDVASALRAVTEARLLLKTYWNGGKALEQSAVVSPGHKHYQAQKLYLAEKFARAYVWSDKFVVSAMGSSVVAGHDNCNYDSYERQMERFLGPVLAAGNVTLTVRNAGEGGGCGDTMENQVWCARHILGDDTDIAHYSWTYFENGNNIDEIHEQWVRWVMMMKQAPAPMIWNTGGEHNNCASLGDTTGKLFNMYSKFGFNTVCLQAGIIQNGYTGKEWGAVGDGMHTITRYGESGEDVFGAPLSEERKKSLGVVFRNWHPGPLGFQVVSDAFSYLYLDAMETALTQIKDLQNEHAAHGGAAVKAAASKRWPSKHKILTTMDLPAPQHCRTELCAVDTPPACTSWEKPVFGGKGIRVVAASDDMNPNKDLAKDSDTGWQTEVAGMSELIPKEEMKLNNPACDHLDHCGSLNGNQEAGWLTLRLPRMELGRIVVCCHASSGDAKQCGQEFARANTVWMFDGKTLPQPTQIYGKCVLVQDKWAGPVNDPDGHLYLSLFVNSSNTIRISQVMTL
mmetsp:Transcript_30215/g.59133  ORF Transcript_30215/g.59133 Transcript_30215/m.59133 type:complete len:648 (-) Transcript_30215:247-2190(-)